MKLTGLFFLEHQFAFQGDMLLHVLLYKNTDPAKRPAHTLGLGTWVLCAKECGDVGRHLASVREIAELAMAGTEPEDYDPYYDAIQDVELDPEVDAPRAYDPYTDMAYWLHPDHTPHGRSLDLSDETMQAAGILLAGPRLLQQHEDELGKRLMRRNEGDPDGPFRPMTDEERALHARQEETAFMEATLFTVDFNHDMARLRELVANRGDFADIVALIGPVPAPEAEAIF